MTRTYMKIFKKSLNLKKKPMLKHIKREIMILKYNYSSLNEEETKLANIIQVINIEIKEKVIKKIITVKRFLSESIIIITDLINIKN